MRRPLRAALCLGFSTICLGVSSAQTPFTEEAISRGLVYVTEEQPSTNGAGLAFADLDNDGDPDVITMARADGIAGFFENDGTGHFTDRTATANAPSMILPSGICAFDYDADGDLDVYMTAENSSNVMLRNDGGFVFTDVTALCGVGDAGPGMGPSAGDLDGDGWLDLSVSNYGTENVFYVNQKNGAFIDMAPSLGLDDPWRTFQTIFFDMDWDGDLDFYISNDKKDAQETVQKNRLYENTGGGNMVDISASSGTDVNIYSMGVAVGDFDGNGFLDLYPTNVGLEANPLLMNQGGGIFQDESAAAGVQSFRTGWGTAFFDYDNDTVLDLYVCNRQTHSFSPQNRLYVHDGSWPAVDVGPALGVDDFFNSYSIALADVDGDGDVDVLTQNNDTNVRLFINQEGDDQNWLQIDVVGEYPNLFAVGADVRVRTGTTWQRQQILAGGNSYKGQNDLLMHFGLGSATVADEVIVRWPDGRIRRLGNVAANRRIAVSQTKRGRAPLPGTTVVKDL